MVKIKIDGKEEPNQFPNMAHALAFAYQNGRCYAAKKLEILEVGTDKSDADSMDAKTSKKTKSGTKPKADTDNNNILNTDESASNTNQDNEAAAAQLELDPYENAQNYDQG